MVNLFVAPPPRVVKHHDCVEESVAVYIICHLDMFQENHECGGLSSKNYSNLKKTIHDTCKEDIKSISKTNLTLLCTLTLWEQQRCFQLCCNKILIHLKIASLRILR